MGTLSKIIAVPHDKLLHLWAGSLATLPAFGVSMLLGSPLWASALLLAAVAGLLREVYNLKVAGVPSVADFVFTVAGALPVVLALVSTSIV